MIVRMVKPRFADLVESGVKCQTVRPVPKRLPRVGEEISLRAWTDRPYWSSQRELRLSKVVAVAQVGIYQSDEPSIIIDGVRLTPEEAEAFAQDDGFASFSELLAWFAAEHKTSVFLGILICWEG